LSPLLNSALRRVIGDVTLTQVVRDDRAALTARVRTQLDAEAQAFGIEVVDVRISRANLPMQNSQAVYQRMQAERQREAAESRAQGAISFGIAAEPGHQEHRRPTPACPPARAGGDQRCGDR
jgi:membrane protease subunit HflC